MRMATRFWLWATGLVAVVLLTNGIIVERMEARQLRESFIRESLAFVRLAGPQALRIFGEGTESGAPPGPRTMERVALLARGLPSLKSLAVLNPVGEPLLTYPADAQYGPVSLDAGEPREFQRFVERDGESFLEILHPARGWAEGPVVWTHFFVSEAPVRERIEMLRKVYALNLTVLLLVAAFLASRVARTISGPVVELTRAATSIREGDLSSRVKEVASGEVGDLARSFNSMASEVERQREILSAQNADLEKAYEELQLLNEELINLEKMAAVGRTAAAVSHEIDNPIGVILGTAEVLGRELGDKPELAEDVAIIEAECRRCRTIVRDLLNLARPTGFPVGPVELDKVVEQVLKGLKHHPGFRDVTVDVAWPETLPTVTGDGDKLKQVFLNILLNAERSMGGRGKITINWLLDDEGETVRVRIGDTGPGVEAGAVETIFEPYFTTGGGVGLGLAVSKRIMEGVGGKIWAEAAGEGGLFVLEFRRTS